MEYITFRLTDDFVGGYADKEVNWGFPIGGGNHLGELVFYTSYSRIKDDGTKERWHETCERVINGMFTILKNHCERNRTPWNELKAQGSAKNAYDRMFNLKWTPPGRGLWAMGTPMVHKFENSGPLQNCSFLSTAFISPRSVREAVAPFQRMMEMSMNGIGVGFDTKGAGKIKLHEPDPEKSETFVVPDSREGWADSLAALLESYFFENRSCIMFDYGNVRPAGAPLTTFGGTASGPEPLRKMHVKISEILAGRAGEALATKDIVDIMNLAGKAVVAGGARRSAQISFGESDDKEFINLKNYEAFPERNGNDGWSYLSNNSVFATVGDDLSHIVENIATNGEPGIAYLDMMRSYSRLIDPPDNKDYRVAGANPCAEQSLEHTECCTLLEIYPTKHESLEDFKATLKVAYLYGKAVTLLPTPWPETNEVMQRNRRIGCSMSGIAEFAEKNGWTELRSWMNEGFEVLKDRDRRYSEWLGVRESIKRTSVKPSGSVSLVAGVTPGVHWPTNDVYIRRMRLAVTNPLIEILSSAGYHIEPDVMDPENTMVVELPTMGRDIRTEKDVTIWEKTALAVLAQRYWADNQVSFTCTFKEEEKDQIGSLLRAFEGQLKALSFLPILEGGSYAQMPYEEIDLQKHDELVAPVLSIDRDALYANGADPESEKYCSNDTCEIQLS